MRRKKVKKVITCLICFVFLFSFLAGCSESKGFPQVGKTDVTLYEAAHSFFYAPLYAAIEEGYFAEEGIDLHLTTEAGSDQVITALLSGKADMGLLESEASVYAYAGGSDDPVVNFAQLTQRAGNFLVSRTPIENFTWNMLTGKQVLSGPAGGMPQLILEYILKKNGMDPKADLSMGQSIDDTTTAIAFSGGQGDFTIELEPYASALEQEGVGYVVASLGESSGHIPYTVLNARSRYLDTHPESVQGVVNALQKGLHYVNSHTSEEIAKVIQPQFTEIDLDTAAQIIARYKEQDTWKENLHFEEDAFTMLQNILEEAGALSERIPYEALVTTRFFGGIASHPPVSH